MEVVETKKVDPLPSPTDMWITSVSESKPK